MAKKPQQQDIIVYEAKTGAIELKGDFASETIWASQAQMAKIFGVNPQAITKHLQNIYKEGELSRKVTCSEMEQVRTEGKRKVTRVIEVYNLDTIIAVGYRINSNVGTKFRIWATKTLRSHIVDGYTINKSRIAQNYSAFMRAVADVRSLLPKNVAVDTESIVELIALFADTWFSLNAYDKENLETKGVTRKKVALTAKKLAENVDLLKEDLMQKGEATELFAAERVADSLESIVGNVMQSFGGKELYPTIEEKAAHILYFIVKNHPFIDGNKRTGAYAFIWFLRMAGVLDTFRVTPLALTALTLLIAESNPKDKDKMTGLVVMLLSGKSGK